MLDFVGEGRADSHRKSNTRKRKENSIKKHEESPILLIVLAVIVTVLILTVPIVTVLIIMLINQTLRISVLLQPLSC